MTQYQAIKRELKKQLLEQLEQQEMTEDQQVQEYIHTIILESSGNRRLLLEEKLRLGRELFQEIRKLDVLQELLEDNEITEIMVNGKNYIFVEKNGKIIRAPQRFDSKEKLETIIQQIVSKSNRVVNESSPIVDARLENGARVNVVLAPVALNGPIVTIRRFPDQPIQMKDLIKYGALPPEVADFLALLVQAKYNILISGGTGSGKTTFLNALSQYIPSGERIITIEDNAELQIQGIENLVRLETRNANVEECQEITIRDLIKTALRMRPSRIIVGEVRGAEAIDMIQCLNTGHDGSLSTAHANSAKDLLYRIETMVLMGMDLPLDAIRRQIASGVDIIVQLGRLRDKSRKVLEIAEIIGIEGHEIRIRPLYEFVEEKHEGEQVKGRLVRKNELENREKWKQAGYSTDILSIIAERAN